MCFNSIYQYSWSVFAPQLSARYGLNLIEVESLFTAYVVFSTAAQLLGGYLADIRGPRLIGIAASIMSSAGFFGLFDVKSYFPLIVIWSLGSSGEGMLYGIAINAGVKWFGESRGQATGIISMGFGLGAAILNPLFLLMNNIREVAIAVFIAEIIVLPLMSSRMSYPAARRGVHPGRVIRSAGWWLLYISFSLATVPLLAISSTLFKFTSGVAFIISLIIFPLLSAVGRPLMGRISDRFSRAPIIAAVLIIQGIASVLGEYDVFLVPEILIGLFGGSLVTLYFSLVGDVYGTKFSTANNGLLYTGKALGGILGSIMLGYLILTSYKISWLFLTASDIAAIVFLLIFLKSLQRQIS